MEVGGGGARTAVEDEGEGALCARTIAKLVGDVKQFRHGLLVFINQLPLGGGGVGEGPLASIEAVLTGATGTGTQGFRRFSHRGDG